MKYLVPTDFSENANNAINYARVLAKATAAELILFHVYTPTVSRNSAAYYAFLSEEVALAVKEAEAKLNELCLEISHHGVACSKLVVTGETVDEIVREAESGMVDLVIMGSLGLSGINKLFFGSNTISVIEQTTRNVIAVPGHAKPLVPQKIVFATDYHSSDLQTMTNLAHIANILNAEIVVLHVSSQAGKSERDVIEKFTKDVAAKTGLQQPYYYVMTHEDTLKGIESVVESFGADLISMSTRRRSAISKFFDTSLTKQIASQARLPLLAFHVTD